MVITDLEHAAEQVAPTPRLRKALAFLQSVQGRDLADGRIDIDGNDVYALVQSYETVACDPVRLEGHRRYIDIQYVISGVEAMGWVPADQVSITKAYDEVQDAWLGTAPPEALTRARLAVGQLAVLYPSDGHAPRLASGAPCRVVKIVVKVRVE